MIFFPSVFTVPWPKEFTDLCKAMEFMAFDFTSLFGFVSCEMNTAYGTRLKFFVLAPFGFLVCVFCAFLLGNTFKKIIRKATNGKIVLQFTPESLKTRSFVLIQTAAFTAYSSIATTVFKHLSANCSRG